MDLKDRSTAELLEELSALRARVKQLEEAQDSHAALIQALPDLLFRISRQGIFIDGPVDRNKELLLLPDQFIGKNVADVLPPELAERTLDFIELTLLTGKIQVFDCSMDIRDETRFYEARFAACGIDEVLVLVIDITERKRNELALRESEENFRALAENSTDLIARFDRQYRHVYVNPIIAKLNEVPREDIVGKTHWELPDMSEEIVRFWVNHIQEVFDTGEPHTVEVTAGYPNIKYYEWRLMPEFGPDGTVQTVLTSAVDVTLVKQAEETIRRLNEQLELRMIGRTTQLAAATSQLEATNAALETERAYLESAFDILPFPIAFVDLNGYVQRANRAWKSFYVEWEGRAWARVRLLISDSHQLLSREQRPVMRALRGEIVLSAESIARYRDGREVPILSHAAPVYVAGEQVGAVLAFQDITELKEADRAKDNFLATLSHELLTPLASIIGWAQLAENTRDQQIADKALTVIRRNAKRQQRIVDDLLDVSRIINHKLYMKPEVTELWSLVEQCTENFQQQAAENRVKLELIAPGETLSILADPIRIQQAFSNLLINALKFTESGGRITVTASRQSAYAVLTVTDTGQGIDPELLPSLFSPFQQGKEDESHGGLGLGLALAAGIAELHHGRIYATSPGVDQGSTFTIELPLASTTSGPTPQGDQLA